MSILHTDLRSEFSFLKVVFSRGASKEQVGKVSPTFPFSSVPSCILKKNMKKWKKNGEKMGKKEKKEKSLDMETPSRAPLGGGQW